MKGGGCAALLIAYRDLIEGGGVEPGVQFAFVCDEETGGGVRNPVAACTGSARTPANA